MLRRRSRRKSDVQKEILAALAEYEEGLLMGERELAELMGWDGRYEWEDRDYEDSDEFYDDEPYDGESNYDEEAYEELDDELYDEESYR